MKPSGYPLGRLRAQLAEFGETVLDAVRDANMRRLLDEQVHQVDEEVRMLRRELDTLKALRITAQERLYAATAKLMQREAQAVAALQAGRQDLARDVAAAIVDLEAERDAEQALLDRNAARSTELQALLLRGQNMLRRLRHELDLMRASVAVASAEDVFSQRKTGAALGIPTAIESAELIKARQTSGGRVHTGETDGAGAEASLDGRLRAAGLAEPKSPVEQVMDRIAVRVQPSAAPTPRAHKTSIHSKDTP